MMPGDKHQKALEAIKDELTKSLVLAYFDPKAECITQVDGSMKGLSAVLLQKDKPVIYASRTLTLAETGYFNIKREVISVVFTWKDYIAICLAAKSRYQLTTSH